MEQITDMLVQFALTILIAILGTVLQSAKKWILAKFGESGVRTAEIIANNAVNAIEQITMNTDVKGHEKLQMAKDWFITVADKQGLKLTDDMIDGFLESAVKSMNDGWYSEPIDKSMLNCNTGVQFPNDENSAIIRTLEEPNGK